MIEFLLGRVVHAVVGFLGLLMALVSWSYLIFAVFSGFIRPPFGHDPQLIRFVQSSGMFTSSALAYFGAGLLCTYSAWDMIAVIFQ